MSTSNLISLLIESVQYSNLQDIELKSLPNEILNSLLEFLQFNPTLIDCVWSFVVRQQLPIFPKELRDYSKATQTHMNKGQLFQSMAFSGTTPVLSEASLNSNIIPT